MYTHTDRHTVGPCSTQLLLLMRPYVTVIICTDASQVQRSIALHILWQQSVIARIQESLVFITHLGLTFCMCPLRDGILQEHQGQWQQDFLSITLKQYNNRFIIDYYIILNYDKGPYRSDDKFKTSVHFCPPAKYTCWMAHRVLEPWQCH